MNLAPLPYETPDAYAVRQTQAWCDEYHAKRRRLINAECDRIVADPERLCAAVLDAMGGDTKGWGLALQSLAQNDAHALQLYVTAAVRTTAEEMT